MTFIQYNCTMHFIALHFAKWPSPFATFRRRARSLCSWTFLPTAALTALTLAPAQPMTGNFTKTTSAVCFFWCAWLRKNISFGIDAWWCWFGSKSTADLPKKIPKGLIGSALLQIKSHIWIQDLLLTIKKSKTRPKHAKVGLITGE